MPHHQRARQGEHPAAPFGDFSDRVPDRLTVSRFRACIYDYYETCGRWFSWRETRDPYRILVSELMLQQTQTSRVVAPYEEFIRRWPTPASLSSATLAEVYGVWKGLGYNRRAKALLDIARQLHRVLGDRFPDSVEELTKLPMVGRATASAVCAFAFGKPVVFLETNIRRVLIHFFFEGRTGVADRELYPILDAALDVSDPRSWYYAVMDYGVLLAKSLPNPNIRSRAHVKQAPFEDSDRQIRGSILRMLDERTMMPSAVLVGRLPFPRERVESCLDRLSDEGMIVCEEGVYRIAE